MLLMDVYHDLVFLGNKQPVWTGWWEDVHIPGPGGGGGSGDWNGNKLRSIKCGGDGLSSELDLRSMAGF